MTARAPAAPDAGPHAGIGERLVVRFPAFRSVGFRRYAIGQAASMGGTWLQNVALVWLVLELTDSGKYVGLVGAAQFLPPLLLGAWAGTVADRVDVRRAVLVLQVVLGIQAAALAFLVFTDAASIRSILVLASLQGMASAFDPPIRQGLVNRIVGDEDLPNAIATNSAMVHVGAITGPMIAGILISTVGTSWCFVANAASYGVMFAAIRSIAPAQMRPRHQSNTADSSVMAGFRYLGQRPEMLTLLGVVALTALFAGRLEVVLPLLAKGELHGGSGLFSTLNVARGIGALCSSVYLAGRASHPTLHATRRAALVLAVALAAIAAPVEPLVLRRAIVVVMLVPAGASMMFTIVATLSMLQIGVDAAYRGRIVACWFVALNLGTVVGSPLSGWVSEAAGTSATLMLGCISMLVVFAVSARSARILTHASTSF